MTRVVVGIISRENTDGIKEYLLVKSAKDFGEFTGAWYPPGGHIEGDEAEKEALIREVKEELDLDVIPVERIAATPGDVPEQTTYWWMCTFAGGEMRLQDEIAGAGFFTQKGIAALKLWPATRTFFEKYIFEL